MGPLPAIAIVPVKRFSEAKQRLSDALAPRQREQLATAMLGDVLAAIRQAELIERVLIISREPRLVGVAATHEATLVDDPGDMSHSSAAAIGIATALACRAGSIALLAGDCPLLDPVELDGALADLERGVVGVIPDRHGSGTNGLLCCPPNLIEPAFGPGSRERHLELAAKAGGRGKIFALDSLALDLDTGGDLEELRGVVGAGRLAGSATAGALKAIEGREAGAQ